VLQIGADSRRLWEFGAGKGGFALEHERKIPDGQTLPLKRVARDWKDLFQPRLNVAWLAIDRVFLRVAHLPAAEPTEMIAMVELQLEKLSPLPVTQIVWSIQILPNPVDNLQTVIVIIVARDVVQELLGQLEGQGYMADRLELPLLDQLLAGGVKDDGAWVYPGNDPIKITGLVAWWHGGILRSVGLVQVSAEGNRDASLQEQLTAMAWAGELEGWLTTAPRWHLVADESAAAIWQPMFRAWLGEPAGLVPPVPSAQLATLTANRAARAEVKPGILPPEYTARYRQQFIDRLWMRGLFAVLGVYILGVAIYFSLLGVQSFKTSRVENEVRGLSKSYTNTLQLAAKLQVLEDRQALKYAALNCWKKIAELLPEGITIQTMAFANGRSVTLFGTAPGDQETAVTDFSEALKKATVDGQPMFQSVELPIQHRGPTGWTWNLSGDLARAEEVQ